VQDSIEVAHATSAFLQAFDSLSWAGFSAHLSDSVDAFWPRPDAAQRLRDRASVESHFKAFFDRVRSARPGPPYLHLNPEDLDIRVIDDVAIVTFELSDVPDTLGRRTLVFHRERDGWRIIHLHASNLPRPR
jgi:ketosteroid isomerase-like protein